MRVIQPCADDAVVAFAQYAAGEVQVRATHLPLEVVVIAGRDRQRRLFERSSQLRRQLTLVALKVAHQLDDVEERVIVPRQHDVTVLVAYDVIVQHVAALVAAHRQVVEYVAAATSPPSSATLMSLRFLLLLFGFVDEETALLTLSTEEQCRLVRRDLDRVVPRLAVRGAVAAQILRRHVEGATELVEDDGGVPVEVVRVAGGWRRRLTARGGGGGGGDDVTAASDAGG